MERQKWEKELRDPTEEWDRLSFLIIIKMIVVKYIYSVIKINDNSHVQLQIGLMVT